MEEELKRLIADALLRSRAFIAGRAFGVPEDAYPEHLDAIANDLTAVLSPVIRRKELNA